jgi:long-chain acyl-CoA synthetase
MQKSWQAARAMKYRNLPQLHRLQAEALGPRPALRSKRDGLFRDLSWQDYYEQALACAAALVDAGVRPGDRVAILSENRVEWLIADMGILAAAAVCVTPHAPLTAAQVQYQLQDSGACWLFASTRGQLDKFTAAGARLPLIRGAVMFDRAGLEDDAIWWPAFLIRGRRVLPRWREELRRREAMLGPDDLAGLLYTSGTTGTPKGVMLTHGNLLSNALALADATPRAADAEVLAWLPLSHIYGRTVDHYTCIAAGTTVALAESGDTVVQNLQELQPTHLSCVPRFYEKLLAAVAGPAPEVTCARLRAIFGPRIEWLGSGGAPLPPAVAQAYRTCGLYLLQGYGLTETSPVLTFNHKTRFELETVGQALAGVELKIAEDGEILTRGPQVMKGYWNDPKATATAIKDGWFHTGDLGALDPDGFLTITGRKKDLIVLSSGKKVAPAHVEGLLQAEPSIDQVVVYGESRNFLAAIIVPQWQKLRQALAATGVDLAGQSEAVLANHPAVRKYLQERMEQALRDVASWERVKNFVIVPGPLSIAAEELTVSLKVRREVVWQHHAAELEALYGSSQTPAGLPASE